MWVIEVLQKRAGSGAAEQNSCQYYNTAIYRKKEKFLSFLNDKEIMHSTSFAKISIQRVQKNIKLFLADPPVKIYY